jgi:hypothetical protein
MSPSVFVVGTDSTLQSEYAYSTGVAFTVHGNLSAWSDQLAIGVSPTPPMSIEEEDEDDSMYLIC